jgi:membrane protease YdiL (CAAX protease family)
MATHPAPSVPVPAPAPAPAADIGTWQRLPWHTTIALHLAPAAVTFAGALMLAPLVARLGLPRTFSLTVAFALLLTPIELGLLLRAAHRATGRWSLRALPAVLAYRRPLRRWTLLVPVLFGVALLIAMLLAPLGNTLGGALRGIYPSWLLPGYDVTTAGFATPVLVATLLVTLLVDGIINPTVEELYFRAYLLPRLPLTGWAAVPTSAALFSLQHYWQPYKWLLIFLLQLILTALVVRLRSVRLGIVMHVLANSFGILVTLFTVLVR